MDPERPMRIRMLHLLIGGIMDDYIVAEADQYFLELEEGRVDELFPKWALLIHAYQNGGSSEANLDYCRDIIKSAKETEQ